MPRRSIVLPGLAVFSVVAALVYWLTRPTLADDARAATLAVAENDPGRLYDYILEIHRQQIGMTRERFIQYWNTLIAPRYSRFRPVGELKVVVYDGGHQAEASLPARDAEGREFDLGQVVWETGHGGRRELMLDLIGAWYLEYLPPDVMWDADNVQRVEAILKGLRADRAKLEALGITHIPGSEPGDRPVSLDEWERRLVRLLGEVKRAQREKEKTSNGQ